MDKHAIRNLVGFEAFDIFLNAGLGGVANQPLQDLFALGYDGLLPASDYRDGIRGNFIASLDMGHRRTFDQTLDDPGVSIGTLLLERCRSIDRRASLLDCHLGR